MVVRARLSAPREERNEWPYHQAKWAALSATVLMSSDRRMEAENYLAGGYGLRLAMEARKDGWARMERLAKVWQPNRLKGIQVSPGFGTPFLAATQVFDLRPVPRKWLSLDRTENAAHRFVTGGLILVTCSGNVGRATLAHKPHENILISHDLLRVEPQQPDWWGWLYAFLRSPQARSMMSAAQYGHMIKHLEVSHLNALPAPLPRKKFIADFNEKVRAILERRNKAYSLFFEAEAHFEEAVRPLTASDPGENGFTVPASALFAGRRRIEGFFHNPSVRAISSHFIKQGREVTGLAEAGFEVWLPERFKRIPAPEGVEFLDSSDLFEISPDVTKRIADDSFRDRHRGRVKAGWLLLARSGQIYGINGSLVIANEAHEGKIISDHIIRIVPTTRQSIRTGYVYIALSHPTLGRPLVKSLAYGSSVPEIDPADMAQAKIVRLDATTEGVIADIAEKGSSLLAEADILESCVAKEAGELIEKFLAGDQNEFTGSMTT